MLVQLQFAEDGERAADVAAVIDARYPHVQVVCLAQPGLTVTLRLPSPDVAGFEEWDARPIAAVSPLDVALEILADTFTELGLEPATLLSLHLSDVTAPG